MLDSFLSDQKGQGHLQNSQLDTSLQKAKEIVDILRQSSPMIVWNGGWILPALNSSTNGSKVARELDLEICLAFRKITFSDWIASALGYEATTVEYFFFDGLSNCCNELVQYFPDLGQPKDTWALLDEVRLYKHMRVMIH